MAHSLPVRQVLILLMLLTFGSALHAAAQSNARPAKVFFSDGHTENGLIEYRNWESSPTSFLFRSEKGSAFQKLDTAQVSAFEVRDQALSVRFEKHTLTVEVTNMDHNGVYAHQRAAYCGL
ncbi:MAG: hypothetical protein INR69_10035 [Mucilaginibacter polytrichastri]|nr:hypothetical protein [Mucilaginibacter polytrichastri]